MLVEFGLAEFKKVEFKKVEFKKAEFKKVESLNGIWIRVSRIPGKGKGESVGL